MMNTKLALIVSVSAYALQINPVYASLLSSPPASILDTNIHTTTTGGHGKLAAEGLCHEARCSKTLLSQTNCRSQTCHNVQSSAPASFSTVILGLDPRIQVKQGFLSHLDNSDLAVVSTASAVSQQQVSLRLLSQRNVSCVALRPSVRHWHDSAERLSEDNNSAGIPRHEAKASARDDNSFLVGSVCFITDTGACSGNSFGGGGGEEYPSGGQPDWNLDNNKRCRDEGYALTSCSSVQQPSNRCPYNSDIFEKCVCKPSLLSCSAGQVGVGDACGGKYASCQCDPKLVSCNALQDGQGATCGGKFERCACKTSLKSCTSPYKGIGSSCDGKYTECCNTCSEYTYTQASIPDGYVSGGTCDSCDGIKHKITPNPCTGFPTSCTCGYDTTSASCKSGSATRYKSCKKCCEPACTSESSCKYGSITQSDGCGGTCTICKKNGDYHCADGSTVADASLCKTDGVIIREDDFCIIISKYQGYSRGDKALASTPSGWKFASLSVMQKASQHINLINQQLNKIGEPNLLNDWYWTSTYYIYTAQTRLLYIINPYSGNYQGSAEGSSSGIDTAYYRYYKECN